MKILTLLFLLLSAANASAAERTAKFSVPGMTCALCPITVRTAMSGVRGVSSVEADLESKSATAVFEETVVTAEAIAEASADAGYPAAIMAIK